MNRLIVLLLAILCMGASCTKKDVAGLCPVATDVQLVDRDVYVPLPDRVTRPVVDPDPGKSTTETTYGRAVTRADTRHTLLQVCNAQLREAAELQGRVAE